jgi:alginate O-acetyltransferase complex protein AlgJ
VDAILRNDAGAFAARRLLSNELKRGRDRLAGKKTVVWEFAIRELANGDWKILDMTPEEVPEATFLTVTEPRTVTATVLSMTEVPRPHSAPYSDHIMSLHLGDIDGGNDQALVYVVSMRDNVWTAAPKLRSGDTIRIELSPWSEYEKQYGTWNRSDFEDEALIVQEPVFGEVK